MSEIFPVHESHEQRQQALASHVEVELHNGQIEIDTVSRPLMSQAEAVEVFGVNGDILATITLPSEHEAREIAIVDYGEPDPTNPRPITVFEGQPLMLMGKARERYGLRALNYTPEGHLSSQVGFNDGATVQLGRENIPNNHDANYKLGLSDGSPENELISRNHAGITIQEGKLTIIDKSMNGSLVKFADQERSEALPSSEEIHAALGKNALQGAEILIKDTMER